MIIGKYIRTLLEEGKRVILPGFGNLELKQAEGGQQPSGTKLNPPGTSIHFDAGFSKDDEMLSGTLAGGENLEADEARQRVLELVDAIRFSLDKGEEYLLPDAGTFSRNEDGKIFFQADPDWTLAPDQYGLESMDLLELEDLPGEEAETENVEVKESLEDKEEKVEKEEGGESVEPVGETKTEAEVTPLATPEPGPESRTRRWRVIWIIAAVLIVILAVLLLVPVKEGREGSRRKLFKGKQDPVMVEQETSAGEQQDAGITDGEQQDGVTEGETAEPGTETQPDEPEVEEPLQVENPHKYFIIAGSFKSLNNASELQDQLEHRGFKAEVMITENRMYRVSVASYATKKEAESGLYQISSEPGLESCWLLSN